MPFWIYFTLLIIAIPIYFFISGREHDKKLIEVSSKRGQISKPDFINQLTEKGFEAIWIEKLYDQILQYVPEKKFTMSPDDNLMTDYRIDDEDLLDITMKLFKEKNGITVSQEYINKAEKFGASILSFEGVLLFLHPEMHI